MATKSTRNEGNMILVTVENTKLNAVGLVEEGVTTDPSPPPAVILLTATVGVIVVSDKIEFIVGACVL